MTETIDDALEVSQKKVSSIKRTMTVEQRNEDAEARRFLRTLPSSHPGNEVRTVSMEAIQLFAEAFKGRMLRRSRDSLDNEGKRVLLIKDYSVEDIWVTLEDREKEAINEAKNIAMEK